MPAINKSFLELLQDDFTKYKCFIETGTYLGETIFSVEPLFNKLHTIEFSEKYYNGTKSKYNGDKINFILLKKIGKTTLPGKYKISLTNLKKYSRSIVQY